MSVNSILQNRGIDENIVGALIFKPKSEKNGKVLTIYPNECYLVYDKKGRPISSYQYVDDALAACRFGEYVQSFYTGEIYYAD